MSGRPALYIKSDLPAGRCGSWSIEHFTVADPGPADSRPACFQSPGGAYTRLKENNEVFMTDLYDEWWTQRSAIAEARTRGGDVLITGLGLGLVVMSVLQSPGTRVRRVVVVERSAEVIELVAAHLQQRYGDRVEIVNADAFTWQPPHGQRFSVGWHDIWPNPHERGVMKQAAELERRFAPLCDWQGNWVRAYRDTEDAARRAAGT